MTRLDVLVVSDDHHVRTALRHLLRTDSVRAHCLPLSAATPPVCGEPGAQREAPAVDVALVDLGRAPDAALSVVASLTARFPVVVLGFGGQERLAALGAGAHAFVDKAADPDGITRALTGALRSHQLERKSMTTEALTPIDRGAREFEALTGRDPEQALSAIRALSPQLHRWLLDGAFSIPLADPRLARRDREIATVAVLAALGGVEPQLRVHLQAALHQGVTPDELRALVEHISVYAGLPRALNALDTVGDVLSGTGEASPVDVSRLALSDHVTELARVGDAGPDVVLLHALGLTWRMWEPVVRRLARGRRVLAYDLRGHGAADDAPPPQDMDVMADDVHEVLERLGLPAAHVVGLSYGGGVAQTFAARYPDEVLSLSLVATTDQPFASFEERARAVERDGVAAQVAPSLTRWFSPQALAENAWGVRYARESVLRAVPGQVAAAWRAFARLDVAGRLERFSRPALVVCGGQDASTGPTVMRAMPARIGGSSYVELDGAPHMPTLETPDELAAVLDDFLPRHS